MTLSSISRGTSIPVVTGATVVSLVGDQLDLRLTGLGQHDVTIGTPVSDPVGPVPIGTPVTDPAGPAKFMITNVTTGVSSTSDGQHYLGPVAGLTDELILATSDKINVTANIPNVFIHTGSGDDALNVSSASGNNVLDGGTGSNFLVGGNGMDTFFVDDRAAPADIWSTVVGFGAGDAATIWGVTPQDFDLAWVDGQGAAGYTGLTLHATAAGKPTASLTLAGYSQDDLNNNRLSVLFGTDPGSGSAYMYVHGNS